ncbi:MAG: NAD-dependent epimerase/dehydratase family protein [Candidatus Solibacter usitatus]|nr:NAD-dependent epimerase/dehydratase family protein [Candidatus Solibacter usitatus]
MKVFLTGATGYIGTAIAAHLIRAGHSVSGLARSHDAEHKLLAAGVEPIRGDLNDAALAGIAAGHADAVIHTAKSWNAGTAALDENAVRSMMTSLRRSKKPFVYTSGTWVIGDTRGRVAGEMAVLRPPEVVAWLPAMEKLVLNAAENGVDGIVIRPAMVYGRGGGFIAGLVKQAKTDRLIRIVGTGENHSSFVHVDALADLYLRAVEQAPRGELFLAADGPAFTTRTVAETVAAMHDARVELIPLEEARRSMGPIADALVMDQRIMSTKAGRLLGWGIKTPSVLEEIRTGSYSN